MSQLFQIIGTHIPKLDPNVKNLWDTPPNFRNIFEQFGVFFSPGRPKYDSAIFTQEEEEEDQHIVRLQTKGRDWYYDTCSRSG